MVVLRDRTLRILASSSLINSGASISPPTGAYHGIESNPATRSRNTALASLAPSTTYMPSCDFASVSYSPVRMRQPSLTWTSCSWHTLSPTTTLWWPRNLSHLQRKFSSWMRSSRDIRHYSGTSLTPRSRLLTFSSSGALHKYRNSSKFWLSVTRLPSKGSCSSSNDTSRWH